MAVHEYKDGDILLARHITAEEWSAGLKFFSGDDDFIQVGVWGYDKDKVLQAHIHNEVARQVDWTQETLYIRKGRIKAHVYGVDERHITDFEAGEGDVLVMLRGGHGYTIIEDGTQVLEVKNGPYVGPDRDRRRFLQKG